MITLKNIRLNNAENKTFLSLDGPIEFKENTVYFIIGRSGVGKTSLIDFITAPFTDTPIKNGNIRFSNEIDLKAGKKTLTDLRIKNSHHPYASHYIDFVRKSIALIPQKTDSFHPSISLAKQIYDYYKIVCPISKNNKGRNSKSLKEKHKEEFNKLLKELSPFAGFNEISIAPDDPNALIINDKKRYIDAITNKDYEIVDLSRKEAFEGKLSTGQLQRIFILLGLIRFQFAEHPILVGDEFLVNFTYPEANEVLKKILDLFEKDKRKNKLGIFVLHDLSFDVLKTIQDEKLSIRLIALEKDEKYQVLIDNQSLLLEKKRLKTETPDMQKLVAHEISLSDFLKGAWKDEHEREVFEKFKTSYKDEALSKEDCIVDLTLEGDSISHQIILKTSRPYKDIYNNINLEIKKKRFIVLTGFSGCGKSTLCNQYLNEYKEDDIKRIRYFPSRSMSFLSENSQISIKQDLSIIYNYYNGVITLDECMDDIKKMLEKVCFYDNVRAINDDMMKEFLNKEIYDLSGGQQQRYWMARLLFDFYKNKDSYIDPDLLILDESIASLDCITKNKIIAFLLEQVLSKCGMSILFVSHDLRDINVIYKTILENVGEDNIHHFFEHYEMFHKGLYKVLTPFPEYKENFIHRNANKYLSVGDKKELILRFDTNNDDNMKDGKYEKAT